MRQTDGIYGGRFCGAGFKGCCMALIDPAFEESIVRSVSEAYLRDFPHLKDRFSVHITECADGAAM
jgi:galactokinase/galacturonokinase